jgi:hypothetical protein
MSPRAAASIALSACLWASLLHAYVLPSSPVLGGWLEKTKGVQTLHVRQRTTVFDSKLSGGSVTVEEEIWIRRPAEYRRTSVYPNGKFEVIVGPARGVRLWGGKTEAIPLPEALGPLGALYLYADRSRMNGFLRQAGIDLNQTRWVLDERQIGLEIGDPRGPHLTFSKQELVPTGAQFGEKNYRLEMAPPDRFPVRYPSHVELHVGGRLSEKTEVLSVETGIRLDDALFEIPRTRQAPGKK